MCTFVDNLHVLKNDKYDSKLLSDELCKILEKKGYTFLPEAPEGDVSLMIYEPDNSSWVSIASDVFLFDTEKTIREYADSISELLNTYVIAASCYDSDYLRLALLNPNDNTDGWINVGKSLSPLIRRTKLAPWNKVIKESDRLKEIVKNKYVFAEEAFLTIAELIEMRPEQCLFGGDDSEISTGECIKLNFSAPEGKLQQPKLKVLAWSGQPNDSGLRINDSFSNTGGKARGLGLMFTGDFIENDEVSVEDVKLLQFDNSSVKQTPVELKKVTLKNGKKCLIWVDDNFVIPPAVNENLPFKKRIELEFKRAISLEFKPKGELDKLEKTRLVMYPVLNSIDGQVSWFYRNMNICNK